MSATGEENKEAKSATAPEGAEPTKSTVGEGKAEEQKAGSQVEGGSKAGEGGGSKAEEAGGSKAGEGGGSKAEEAGGSKAGEGGSKAGGEEGEGEKKKAKAGPRAKGEKATADTAILGFIGAGKMAEAIIRGLNEKKANLTSYVASKSGKNHDMFKQMGTTCTKRLYDIFAKYDCDVIFVCVHGLVIKECFKLGGVRPLALTVNFIPVRSMMYHILSLVGGIPVSDIKSVLLNPDMPEKYRLDIHRIMLNCSVAYGIGLGVIDVEPDSKKMQPLVRDLLVKIAKIEHYTESQIDILCTVGGNGLAFIYYFVSALADGGFRMGLPKKTAVTLATKTLHASALCMLESGKHASELRDQCTSPSGPAIYGIANLEKRDCASGVSQAVEAAFKRLKELVDIACT